MLTAVGCTPFIGDIDPQALSDIQKELRDAPAWNNVMTDSAKMIRQELMGKSVNGEITSEEYADWVRTVVDHERETGRGVQAVSKWSRRDDASTQADAIKALDKNTTMTDQQRSDAFQKIVKWDYAVDNAKPGDLDTIKSTILDIAKDRGTVSNAFTGKTSRRLERAAMKSLDGLTFDELKAFAA